MREHLLSGGLGDMDQSLKQNIEGKSHARLSEWCQRYMKLGILNYYDLSEDSSNIDAILAFFVTFLELESTFPFLRYALYEALPHLEKAFVAGVVGLDGLEWFPLRISVLLSQMDPFSSAYGLVKNHSATLLYLLIVQGCSSLAEALLQHYLQEDSTPDDDSDRRQRRPENMNADIDLRTLCGGKFGCPLQAAAARPGSTRLVGQLLMKGQEVNLPGGEHGSALGAAACDRDGAVAFQPWSTCQLRRRHHPLP